MVASFDVDTSLELTLLEELDFEIPCDSLWVNRWTGNPTSEPCGRPAVYAAVIHDATSCGAKEKFLCERCSHLYNDGCPACHVTKRLISIQPIGVSS